MVPIGDGGLGYDGASLAAVGVDMGGDAARRETGIKPEKHWGHW